MRIEHDEATGEYYYYLGRQLVGPFRTDSEAEEHYRDGLADYRSND